MLILKGNITTTATNTEILCSFLPKLTYLLFILKQRKKHYNATKLPATQPKRHRSNNKSQPQPTCFVGLLHGTIRAEPIEHEHETSKHQSTVPASQYCQLNFLPSRVHQVYIVKKKPLYWKISSMAVAPVKKDFF